MAAIFDAALAAADRSAAALPPAAGLPEIDRFTPFVATAFLAAKPPTPDRPDLAVIHWRDEAGRLLGRSLVSPDEIDAMVLRLITFSESMKHAADAAARGHQPDPVDAEIPVMPGLRVGGRL